MRQEKENALQKKLYQHVVRWIGETRTKAPTKSEIAEQCHLCLKAEDIILPTETTDRLIKHIQFSVLGLGPLEVYLQDDSVTEIMVNGPDMIFVERKGRLEKTDLTFFDEEHLRKIIQQIVGKIGRRIDERTPLVDARLPDGSRVNAIIPPLSLKGSTLTIRKFPAQTWEIKAMLKHKTLSKEMADFLSDAVRSKKNIIISGGTGSGKTSTLNALANLIPKSERIITIEDSAEMKINHPHLISLESRNANIEGTGEITIRALLKNALRMRPDRIVVGEIRGGEAIDMLQAMNTGHQGSLTTIHANAPLESLYRLETMVLMGDLDLPITAIRPQIIQAIDIIVQQERRSSGERRIVSIAEITKGKSLSEYKLTERFSS
jgi:pilus assembly protein CpaF